MGENGELHNSNTNIHLFDFSPLDHSCRQLFTQENGRGVIPFLAVEGSYLVTHDFLHHVLNDCEVAICKDVHIILVSVPANDGDFLGLLVKLKVVNPATLTTTRSDADSLAEDSLDELLTLHVSSLSLSYLT